MKSFIVAVKTKHTVRCECKSVLSASIFDNTKNPFTFTSQVIYQCSIPHAFIIWYNIKGWERKVL